MCSVFRAQGRCFSRVNYEFSALEPSRAGHGKLLAGLVVHDGTIVDVHVSEIPLQQRNTFRRRARNSFSLKLGLSRPARELGRNKLNNNLIPTKLLRYYYDWLNAKVSQVHRPKTCSKSDH